jgi:hypothetical protein
MRLGAVVCALAGHRRRVDESTETEPVLCCDRCGRKELAPAGSGYGNRVDAKARATNVTGRPS